MGGLSALFVHCLLGGLRNRAQHRRHRNRIFGRRTDRDSRARPDRRSRADDAGHFLLDRRRAPPVARTRILAHERLRGRTGEGLARARRLGGLLDFPDRRRVRGDCLLAGAGSARERLHRGHEFLQRGAVAIYGFPGRLRDRPHRAAGVFLRDDSGRHWISGHLQPVHLQVPAPFDGRARTPVPAYARRSARDRVASAGGLRGVSFVGVARRARVLLPAGETVRGFLPGRDAADLRA